MCGKKTVKCVRSIKGGALVHITRNMVIHLLVKSYQQNNISEIKDTNFFIIKTHIYPY